MNEIIKINYDSEHPTVLGRDLHKALEVKTAYNQECVIMVSRKVKTFAHF